MGTGDFEVVLEYPFQLDQVNFMGFTTYFTHFRFRSALNHIYQSFNIVPNGEFPQTTTAGCTKFNPISISRKLSPCAFTMAAEDRPEYVFLDVSLARANQENRAEVAVLSDGRRFNIDFRQMDLHEPGQSHPSKFELEYLAVLPEFDEFWTQNSAMKESPRHEGTPSKQKASDAKVDTEEHDQHLRPCNGEFPEDPLEAWIVRPFIQHWIFRNSHQPPPNHYFPPCVIASTRLP